MKLMIAGGGTGGHLFPGLALASAWLERAPDASVFFVGTERGLEKTLVPQAGHRLRLINQVGLKRTDFLHLLKGLLLLPKSLFQSLRIVLQEKPSVAIGVGGYAAGPVILAAWLLRVPTLILEPNAAAGLSNRLLAKLARVAISPYEHARVHFGKKLVKAGIPVRPAIASAPQAAGAPTRSLLVFGGSQGARAINDVVVQAAPALLASGYGLVHQTGALDFARVSKAYAGLRVDVRAFITDMASAYARCDLVVCRAGASSLAELALLAKPSVLIPLPTAADDHQSKNALAFVDAGAAVLLKQNDLNVNSLCQAIDMIMGNEDRRQSMARAARRLGDANAAYALCELCLRVARGEKV